MRLACIAIWASCSSPGDCQASPQQIAQDLDLPSLEAIAGEIDLNKRVAALMLCDEVLYCYLQKPVLGHHPTSGYAKRVRTLPRSPSAPDQVLGVFLEDSTFDNHGSEIQALAESRTVIAMPVLIPLRGIRYWIPGITESPSGVTLNPAYWHLANPVEAAAVESLLQWRRVPLQDLDRHLDCRGFSIAHLLAAIEYGVIDTSYASSIMMECRDPRIDCAITHELLVRSMSCTETPIEGGASVPGLMASDILCMERFLILVACARLGLDPNHVLTWGERNPDSQARLIALALLARKQ